MNDPLAWMDDEAADRAARGLARRLFAHGSTATGRFVRDGRPIVNFGSNDYLGLATDPRVIAAAHGATATYGWGAGASPLLSGWTDAHQALVDALADFEETEAVALFPTGFAANFGAVAALVTHEDVVFLDRLNHACLIDGARLSRAHIEVYPHGDADALAALLQRNQRRFRRSLIATDGVFSMDGTLAPLARLAELAEEFQAMLLVDEAHGTGVFGPDGRGAAAACGVAERVHIRVGTLSKALGSVGGFVAGSRRLIDHLVNHGRPLIYSTSLPPAAAMAAREALATSQAEPWRREQAAALAETLRAGLTAAGFDVGRSQGVIVPILLGAPEKAVRLSERLLEQGFYVPGIRPPTVPEGTSRLRVSVTAAHTADDVEALLSALGRPIVE